MSSLMLEVASGSPLDVRRFRVHEAMSDLFEVTVTARSPDPSLDLDAIVGHPASFGVVVDLEGARGGARRWSGICRSVEQEQPEPTGLSTYRFHIVPVLWLLTQRRDHRIVQHRTSPDVVKALLDGWRIDHALAVEESAHPSLPYLVQYAESDYAFFCRILEEAGIAFTFPPGEAGHGVLTLSDRLHAGVPRHRPLRWVSSPNADDAGEHLTEVHLADETRPGAYVLRDHDLRRPSFRLFAEAVKAPAPEDAYEQYHYRPGSFLVDTTASGNTPTADDAGAMRHDREHGSRRAARLLESERADKRVVSYRTNAIDLWPGRVFSVVDHPHPDLDPAQRLLAIDLTLEGAPGEDWTCVGRAVLADAPYRPPVRTPRRRARIQSATVVGAEEISPDEHGRVRVRFHWDRTGESTVWVRVSETWAGAGYGMITLPRVGHEVLVDFLEGDPEQPVVVGRVFNQTSPVPETLPDRKTRSVWKSDSSPGSAGFNEILLEDRKGGELLYAQAQKDARRLVKHDDTSTVVHDRQKLVRGNEQETTDGNRTQETKRDRTELTYGIQTTAIDQKRRDRVFHEAVERNERDRVTRVGKDLHVLTAGSRRELVEHDAHVRCDRSRPESVGGTDSLTVGTAFNESVGSYSVIAEGPKGWIHLIAGSKIVIESDAEVTIKQGGSNFVKVDGQVTIVGSEVAINEGGSSPGDLPGPARHRPETPRMALVDEPDPPVVAIADPEQSP